MRGKNDRDLVRALVFGREVISMAKNNAKGTRATRAGQLIAGTRKHFPNGGDKLTFGGGATTVTVDAAIKELQTLIDLREATTAAQATAKGKVAAERAQTPALVAFMNAFEQFVRFTLGADTNALADFGLTPRKGQAPKTAVTKAVAAAKGKATREARGTKGPKAKKAIHGNVTATLVVTPGAPPAEGPQVPATAPPAAPGATPPAKA
jgi:hypothetical protein